VNRYGLVVHPSRNVHAPREALLHWAREHGVEVVALGERLAGHGEVPTGEADGCEVIVAIGGDGTILGGARLAAAAPSCPPVLGLAYGSLGMLAAVEVADAVAALDRFAAGEWTPRALDGLRVTDEHGASAVALNDVAVVRKGAGQVKPSVYVDGELFVRAAGDGVVVSTALGSSAYGMAAGGPLLAPGTRALCITPLSMHGGCAPPLVVGGEAHVRIAVAQNFSGRRLELDGQPTDIEGHELDLRLERDHVQVVRFTDGEGFLTGLRRRGILADSPRVVAHDERTVNGEPG
jgi:NAD+ kinase